MASTCVPDRPKGPAQRDACIPSIENELRARRRPVRICVDGVQFAMTAHNVSSAFDGLKEIVWPQYESKL